MDTEIFKSKNFNFKNYLFQRLINATADNLITVYITDIVKHEVESKIKENLFEELKEKRYEKITKDLKILRNIDDFDNVFNIDFDIVYKKLLESFSAFLIDVKAVVLPSDKVLMGEVFRRYFTGELPFSNKKKSEFPDAVSLLALEDWFKEKNQSITVLSNDNDLKNFCQKIDFFDHEHSLESFFNTIAKDKIYIHEFLVHVYDALQEEICFDIVDCVNDSVFTLDSDGGNVNFAQVNEVSIEEDPYIIDYEYDEINQNQGVATIAFTAMFLINANVSVVDYNSSPYDKEEHKFLFLNYEDRDISDLIRIPIVIEVRCTHHEKQETEIINIIINEEEPIPISIVEKWSY